MSYREQQEFIADGKSRFCAGEEFDKFHLDPGKGGKGLCTGKMPGPRPRLQYGGAKEYLIAQASVMSDAGREDDVIVWVLRQKIYIVGVLVGMIEAKCPWSTENRDNILWFKKNIGEDKEFLKVWCETLERLLGQQDISLENLMSAEMLNERRRHEQKAKVAKIMRKPEAEITAEDMKLIEKRIASREDPSSSSSRPNLGKGNYVEDGANKGTPQAAPAVVRKISKAPPAQPPNIPPAPRRPTPLIDPPDPPAKRAKGASKGAAERAALGSKGAYKGAAVRAESGSRYGKGKGKGNWGGKGKPKGGPPDWYRPPGRENFDHLPAPPPPFDGHAPDRRIDGEERFPIRRNVYEDFRETDRRRRERVAEPPNDAYRDWHEHAWAGQYLAPPAGNRCYGKNAGYHAEFRSRSGGWQPSLNPPTNMSGRHRTRSPMKGHNRCPGPNSRVFHHDGNTEWEVVDDGWWDEQNQRSQDRRNEEYQLERAD